MDEEILEAVGILLSAIDDRMELYWRVQERMHLQLERIADTHERLLKLSEMSR